MEEIFIGIDCGGTSIRAACADRKGHLIYQKSVPTFAPECNVSLEDKLIILTEELIDSLKTGEYRIKGIGMGIPGVYYCGEVLMCPNIGGLKAREIIRYFDKVHGLPFNIMNDVKCAALGEKWLGAAVGVENAIFVNIGTGLSLALILNGEIFMGENNASGEIGYWLYDTKIVKGYGSGSAPLEEIFSGKGIVDSMMTSCNFDTGKLSTKQVFEEYMEGNSEIIRVVDANAGHFITTLANISILLNPRMIIFGGSVSESIDLFLDRMAEYFKQMVLFPPVLKKSELGGNAGLYGAIRFAMLSENKHKKGGK